MKKKKQVDINESKWESNRNKYSSFFLCYSCVRAHILWVIPLQMVSRLKSVFEQVNLKQTALAIR